MIDEQGLLVPPVTNDPAVLAEAAMLSIFTRANPQPIREPADVVKILKLAA